MTASSLPSAFNFQDMPSVFVNLGLILIGYKEEEKQNTDDRRVSYAVQK
jgi:hypothetical protein